MRLPFSMFVNELLQHINRAPGQIHPIGWLNITIFQVACKKAGIQATVPLFASLLTSKHRSYDTSLAAKGRRHGTQGPHPVDHLKRGGYCLVISLEGYGSNQSGGGGYEREAPSSFQQSVGGPQTAGSWGDSHPCLPSEEEFFNRGIRLYFKKGQDKSISCGIRSLLYHSPSTGENWSEEKAISSGEEPSLDCYTSRYMKAPYTLPNGLCIEEGHLWNKHMEAFHVVRPLLLAEEGRKHPSSDPMDAFALSAFYMIKALNANYVYTRREVMKEVSSEKTQAKLKVAQVSLNERDEELNSCKEALSAEKVKRHKLQKEKQAMELEDVKSCNTLEAELEKLKPDQSSLAKDVEDTRSAKLEAIKKGEVVKARASEVETRLSQMDAEIDRRLRSLKIFKEAWPEPYFEGLFVDSHLAETPTENVEATREGDEVAEEAVDDEATT
ncbi:hypothetical protein LIER_22046 [Lithospermum erythrorhizon]|uniref:Transposase (putative) gypsy type domain-containing protein n=1 Tax=Lithospermum erythrorhizon TaxID=34254 RepID=A0AAV3QTJ4_LITER